MRDYQRTKNNKYILPKTVYHKTLWHIRDYYRIKELADDLINGKAEIDCPSNTNSISDPVANIAVKRTELLKIIEDIDEALQEIPKEYRNGVWFSIQRGQPYPQDADRSTYGKWKARFIKTVANKLHFM